MASYKRKTSGKKRVKKRKKMQTRVQSKEQIIRPELKVATAWHMKDPLATDPGAPENLLTDDNESDLNVYPIKPVPQGSGTTPFTPRNTRVGGQIQLQKLRLAFRIYLNEFTHNISVRIIVFRYKRGLASRPVIKNNILLEVSGTSTIQTKMHQALQDYYPEQLNSGFVVHYDKIHRLALTSAGVGEGKEIIIKVPKVKGLIQKFRLTPDGSFGDITSNQFFMAILPCADNAIAAQTRVTCSMVTSTTTFYDC